MWKSKNKVIKLPKERWKTGLWIWICSLTESQKVIPLIKKRNKKKKDSQKVSEKHGLKINCLEDIWYIHFKKNVFGYLKTYVEICVSENVCRNTWYLKTKNVCLSGCTKHLLKKEKRKIVVLFGVGLSLMKNFYVFLGFIYIVLIF